MGYSLSGQDEELFCETPPPYSYMRQIEIKNVISFLTEGPSGAASSLYLPYKCMERPLKGLSEMRYSEYLELGPDPKKPTLRGSQITTSLQYYNYNKYITVPDRIYCRFLFYRLYVGYLSE